MTALQTSLARALRALNEITETSPVWPRGLLNPGGPHHRIAGQLYPISIGEDECLVFGRLIEEIRPQHALIIGNAFGLSSAYIAEVMRAHGGCSVTTLDDESEGQGERVAAISRALTKSMGLSDILHHRKGASPQDIAASVDQKSFELIFVDGLHRHPQVMHDFLGILPYCRDDTVVVFHDGWIIGVPEAVRAAKRQGFHCWWVPTSCEMILATRSARRFAALKNTFPRGVEDRKRRSYLYGYLLHLREVFAFRWRQFYRRGGSLDDDQ